MGVYRNYSVRRGRGDRNTGFFGYLSPESVGGSLLSAGVGGRYHDNIQCTTRITPSGGREVVPHGSKGRYSSPLFLRENLKTKVERHYSTTKEKKVTSTQYPSNDFILQIYSKS